MAEREELWTRDLHALWMAALAAVSGDELDGLILATLGDLPGAVSAWTARLDSRGAVVQHRGGPGADLPGEVRAALTGGLEHRATVEIAGAGPLAALGVRVLLTAVFAVPDGRVSLALAAAAAEPIHRRFAQVADVQRRAWSRLAQRRSRAAAESRDALLAEASVQMDAVLDASQTLHRVARMAVPAIAEGCVVYLSEEGGVRRRAGVHVDARRQRAVNKPGPAGEWLDGLAAAAPAATGPMAVPAATASLVGAHTVSVHALRARGRVLGALIFLFDRAAARLPDPEFLSDLTYRAALAIDNSELYEQRRRDVFTLQQHLLPARLSPVAGLRSSAGYEVAERSLEVGGDFYDLVPRPDTGGAALIGDVCGRGAGAAALTGMARHTLATLLQQGASPARALGQLNTALVRDGSWRFVTAAAATFTPQPDGSLVVQLACAGHPAPIVLPRQGPPAPHRGGGTALGVVDPARIGRSRLRLAAGDTLLMFTDGLTEARDGAGRMFEDDGLMAALDELRDSPVQTLVPEIIRAAAAFRTSDGDDIAVLAVRAGDDEGGGDGRTSGPGD